MANLYSPKSSKKQNKAIIQRQTFSLDEPGPLLTNIQMMIEAIRHGIPTTSKYFALPISCLPDLNTQLSTPLAHKMTRPQMKTFPAIAGLFLLLRAAKLAKGEAAPQRMVSIDPIMLESWDSLNPTEKYMSLVDIWITKANWTTFGERDYISDRIPTNIKAFYFFLHNRNRFDSVEHFGFSYSYKKRIVVTMLEQFGWIKIGYTEDVGEGKFAEIRSIERTEFGDAMISMLVDELDHDRRTDADVKRHLKPLLSEWRQSLQSNDWVFREGRYTLKISLGPVWRRLIAPAAISLKVLNYWVLHAFQFEEEHLYQFSYRDPNGQVVEVAAPYMVHNGLYADEFLLGELPLAEGESFQFLFDLDCCWDFNILIEKVEESVTKDFKPKVIEEMGEAPSQYEGYDY